jgi:hypothetical protein
MGGRHAYGPSARRHANGAPSTGRNRVKTNLVGLVLLGVVLQGCGGFDEDPQQQALYQLTINRQKWENQRSHNYSFDYDVSSMLASRPLRIDVRSDTVNHVTDRLTGAVYANAGNPTVDSLFARVEHAISATNVDLRVQYNTPFGFPELINQGSNIPDTGYTITVSNFVKAP